MPTPKLPSCATLKRCLLLCIFALSCCSYTSKTAAPVMDNTTFDQETLLQELTTGTVTLDQKELAEYAEITDCLVSIEQNKKTVTLSLSMPAIPQSDDAYLYLFRMDVWEKSDTLTKEPIAEVLKNQNSQFQFAYNDEYLFNEFVPALLVNDKYIPISIGHYITNPEVIAKNQDSYPNATSKKGLLLDPQMLGTPLLTDLGVQHAIYNIPLFLILGETSDKKFPTISYDYQGTTYYFNGATIDSYDNLFSYLTNSGMLSTAIILNDWNETNLDMIHPLARVNRSGAFYYAFNTAEENGCKHLEAVASFLAARYSGGEHGLVSSWVISNEINQRTVWNYMNTTDINLYAEQYEKSLRIFYNAIKSNYANAKVYFSVDHY